MAYDNNIPSYEEIRALSIVYLRAVALAWQDDEVGQRFKKFLFRDTNQALTNYFNYQCPFSVKFGIQETLPDQHATWIPTKHEGGKIVPGHWSGLLPNELVYLVPNKPEPMYDEAIALSAYVASGPNYLFSCC